MDFEGGNLSVARRLSLGKQEPYFFKQIVADTENLSFAVSETYADAISGIFHAQKCVPVRSESRDFAVDRKFESIPFQPNETIRDLFLDSLGLIVKPGGLRSVYDNQP